MTFSDPSGMSAQLGGRNISNWNGAMASEQATEGISPWPEADVETDTSAANQPPQTQSGDPSVLTGTVQEPLNPDASTNNGNPTDIRTDQLLAGIFTNPIEGAIVRGASSGRASDLTGDTHYKLGDGRLHTIHIYGNMYGTGIVGVYIPKGFIAKFIGGDYNTVVATNSAGVVIGIAHLNVTSQKQLEQNLRTTNEKGSRLVGMLGGAGQNAPGNVHAHLSIFPSANARRQALAWKTAGKHELRDFNRSISRWLGDFRRLVRR